MNWDAFWRLFVFRGRPFYHVIKKVAFGCCGIISLETVLLYHYWPSRPSVDQLPSTVFALDKPFIANNPSHSNLTESQIAFIIDLLSAYNDKSLGLHMRHYHKNVIVEDPWYRWIGIREIPFHFRSMHNLVPDPTLTNIRIDWMDLSDDEEETVRSTEHKETNNQISPQTCEQLVISFNAHSTVSSVLDEHKPHSYNNDESYAMVMMLELNSDRKIIYQRNLWEHKYLITPNTDPYVLGYLCKWIRRANSFWYRVVKTPSTLSDV
ncbi:hypothetical protein RFI_11213 [Reticulomyxa filosa]|uniref:Uncharacterized protein n=1 Tax=Reticulomyxa filosa TaxID=46433 RepID=X6NIY3_RETFI|nr:hypothetical protein RFI_11213 [Reticulomyxa filosa]|eukprot:ETO25926.1 hypothetical protein RFI_11213 [Reticulomyxa filosa]